MSNEFENSGNRTTEQWMELVYDELRRIAVHRMNSEKPGQTLQVTALVHEAYLRLKSIPNSIDGHSVAYSQADPRNTDRWNSRGHFFAAAAEAMRRILVDRARQKKSVKHGGQMIRIELGDPAGLGSVEELDQFLALDVALEKLASIHPRKAQLVTLRYFAGLTIAEAADALNIATSTADADWVYARSWLKLELLGG